MQVGKATKELHARLTKLDENWKRNEIAERIQQQKNADMALLQNRWKSGVLNEDAEATKVCRPRGHGVVCLRPRCCGVPHAGLPDPRSE